MSKLKYKNIFKVNQSLFYDFGISSVDMSTYARGIYIIKVFDEN